MNGNRAKRRSRRTAFLKRLDMALKRVNAEIRGNGESGDTYARGLANEGYAGGYAAALRDIEAMLTHGHPSDTRCYWIED